MKLLVLDGNSILNRAFYGIKLLTTKAGDFTNGIYGFLTMLKKLLDETAPGGVAIAFDRKAPTFRHKAYAGYKANRKGMPEELAQQLPVLQELLTDLGYRIVSCEGWEADDILGTLAAACEREGSQCLIATGDRDSLQLVSDSTSVRLATTKFGQPQVTLYDVEKIQEEYGVTPRQMIDLKAIQGDSSDCIPGVAGIGPKGAGELIQKFGSLQYLYDHLEELDIKPAMKAKLEKSRDNAFLSYDLGTIRRDAPIDTDLSHYEKGEGDPQKAAALMVKLELFSLLDKFGLSLNAQPQEDAPAAERPGQKDYEDGAPLLPMLEDAGEAYFYAQWEAGELASLVFAHKGEVHRVKPDEAFLRAFFKNDRIQKYTHDTKPLHRRALELGCKMEAVRMDTALAGYLLNPSASGYDVERLCAEYGVALADFEEPELRFGAAMPGLCQALEQAIAENSQQELLEAIEIPLSFVLAQMEHIGFYVDKESIRAYGKELEASNVSDVEEISGHGVTAKVNGKQVAAGNAKLMKSLNLSYTENTGVGTVVHVAVDGKYAGYILISDVIKDGAKEAIASLKNSGVKKCVMLTGDSKTVAEYVAGELKLDEVHSELLPADKVSCVEKLLQDKSEKEKLAFVGDGINDAPVLSRADIGIAMGALGSDAAIEAADVVLMDDNPAKIALAMRISRKCLRIVYENIVFALAVKAICLILGALGIANMWVAIFADVGVMVLAVLNAIRCLRIKNN